MLCSHSRKGQESFRHDNAMCQKKLQLQCMCHMFSFCGITGMLIFYVYREKDREKNGDANKNVHRDLRDTAKKNKKEKNYK